MRYGAKRVISLLTALVMVSSFVVVPVSAVTSPTVTLSSGQTQTKYIFANSEYNSLEKMTELAEPIKGTYNGEDVELIPKWEKPEKLFNGFQGSREGHYGANKFTATTFTVKGTGEDITPSGVEVTLNVWVIGVYAKLEVDKTPIIMTKSEALAVGIDNEFASVLDLPTEASVTYESAKFSDHPDWNTAAGELDTSNDLKNYNITGWYMFGYYDEAKNPLRITPETLRNLAGEVGVSKDKQEVTLFPHYSDEPKWATVDSGDANIILKITPDPTVTVMMPEREYKCYSEGEQVPGATATAKIGEEEMENATFSFMYEGIDGTTYSNNTPPTDAGKYKVTATLTTPGYSGEGSAEFTISKAANGTTNANILVPAGDTQRFSISALKLPVGMAKGAKIKKASPITGGSVLDSVTADKTSFTLKTKQAEEKESQSFNLVLTSDNYDTLTVNVTATVDNSPVTLPKITVKEPYVFEYGTPLSEIVEIIETGTGFDLQDPTEVYNVGEYSRIYVESTKNGVLKEVPVTFTIVPATIQSFDNESSAYVQYGYWTTIYANHKKNIENNLTKLFPKTYTGFYANGEKITLNAEWSLDDGSAPYNPRGYEDNVWYEYTAHLTPVPPEGTTGEVFARNFNISDAPKGHIRVMPANAYQTIDSESKVVEKEEVGQWTDDDWETKLSLPQTADVTYVHAPEKISSAYMLAEESTDTTGILAEESTAAAYIAAGAPPAIAYKLAREAVNDSDELEETEETTGTYEINGWKMEDDTNLTLQRIRDEGVSEIRLTPIYKETPAWATWEDFLPTFTLVITEGDVPTDINSVTVTKPKDIIYGVEVDKPIVEGIGEDDVTFKYEGMYGTNYYDTNKPTNAGDYRVVATWKENPSVRWTSEVFTIAPKEVKIIGIKCKTGGREYDGTTNANSVLDVENAKVLDDEKTIPGVTVSAASGYFADDVIGEKNQDGTGKNVGTNKTVVVIDATLIGEGAGNYKFVPFRETEDGQEATTTTR